MRHYLLLPLLLSPLLSFASSTTLDTIAVVVDEDVDVVLLLMVC